MPFLESCAGQLEEQPDADSYVISRRTVSGKKLGGGNGTNLGWGVERLGMRLTWGGGGGGGGLRDWEWD